MILAGLLVTLVGFLVAMLGPGIVAGTGGRMTLALLGIAISLVGIMGMINRAYLKNAIWKR